MTYSVEKEMEKCARKGISYDFDLASNDYIQKARMLILERAFEECEKIHIVPFDEEDVARYLTLKSEIEKCARRCEVYVILSPSLKNCLLLQLKGQIGIHICLAKKELKPAFIVAGDMYCWTKESSLEVNFCDPEHAEMLFSTIPKVEAV